MTTHLRARVFQAGALLALIGGALVVMPSPAQAAPPTVKIDSLSPANLRADDRSTLKFTVTNKNSNESNIAIEVSSSINQVHCEGDSCRFNDNIAANASKQYSVSLVGGKLASGTSTSGTLVVRAAVGPENATASQPITLRGDENNPTVREVAGKVRDQTGKAVANAQVGLLDSANRSYATSTNVSGNFRFTSTDQQPIAPGTVVIGARKDGYKDNARPLTVNAKAGASLTVSLTLPTNAAVTPSATPEPSASATATANTLSTGEATAPAAVQPVTAAGDANGGSSMIYIIFGVLLVAAGIGAIVLVLMRRKDGEPDPNTAGPLGAHASAAAAPRQGRYGGPSAAATQIVNRGDATMLAGAPIRPGMSDAPTMLHQPVPADEYPDPYGAPAGTSHVGYGAPSAGWGAPADNYPAPPANQYGGPPTSGGAYGAPGAQPYGGQPSSGAGYGAAAPQPAGYGAPAPQATGYGATDPQRYDDQRFDEPTGRYDPAARGGYRSDTGYEQSGGYRAPGQGSPYGAPVSGRPADQGGAPAGPSGFRPAAPAASYPAAEPNYPQAGRQQPGSGAPYQAGGYETGGYQAGNYQPGGAPAGPAQAGGYPRPTSGSAAGGYAPEQSGTYGSWSPGGGIDSGNAYGAPAGNYGRSDGYQAPPATGGGYDEPTGYEPAGYQPSGYQPRSTYGQPESYRQPEGYGAPEQPPGRAPQAPGHGPQPGGYDNPGYYGTEQPPLAGRHGGQPNQASQPEPPGQRRSLDWLDD